jgi:MoaA/NifB/PqqE/SkfB family radical SAM enzyme
MHDAHQPGDLRSIDLYITARCNLKCATCFLGDDYFTGHLMSTADALAILQWARRLEVDDVALLGGEPTLHSDLESIIGGARGIGYTKVRLVTNGGKRAQSYIESSCHLPDVVYLSLDGARNESHDAVRGRGSFAEALRTAELTKRRSIDLVVTFTVTRQVAAETPDVIAVAEALGAMRLNIHWMSATGRAAGGGSSLTPREWVELSDAIKTHPRRSGMAVDIQDAYEASSGSARMCAVRSLSNLQFMPDRRVHACGIAVDNPSLSSYEWTGDSLVERSGATERHHAIRYRGDGCPLRQGGIGEPPIAKDPAFRPVCIYSRTSV